jgi:hypothetical protein
MADLLFKMLPAMFAQEFKQTISLLKAAATAIFASGSR